VRCPAHDDTRPSLALYADGHGYCFACGHRLQTTALERPRVSRPRGPLPWSLVTAYQRVLWGPFAARLGFFLGRGFVLLTVEKLRFGHTGLEFVIPNWDREGRLVSVKYRRDDRLAPGRMKYRALRGEGPALYGLWQPLKGRIVLLCEGELDAALLIQELWRTNQEGRYTAVAVTAGALCAPRALEELAGARGVIVLYDQDAAGREGAWRVRGRLAGIVPWARVAVWPMAWGKDVTDAIRGMGFEQWWNRAVERPRGRD
jgi:hypothetical protein